MRKLLSVLVAGAFTFTLGACSEQTTAPDVSASQHDPGAVVATADLNAVDKQAAELNGFEKGDDVGTLRVADDQNADKLTVTGDASGFDPDNEAGYVSLFYDVESTVMGPEACEPALGIDGESDDDRVLSLAQMEIGAWNVHPNGTANLPGVEMTGDQYIQVDKIGTVSIRDLRVDGPFGPGTGPDAVVACGYVHAN